MDPKSLGIKMFWLAEMIVSARVLLFTIPVLISRLASQEAPSIDGDERFVFLVSVAALMYFFIGLASLLGHKLWRLFHCLGAVVVLVLTLVFFQAPGIYGLATGLIYLLPFLLSLAGLAYVYAARGRPA